MSSLKPEILILPLSLEKHRELVPQIDRFWLSQAPVMKPHHHALFALLHKNISCVLELNGEIVSYVYAAAANRKIFVHIIATKPQYYGRGYASRLLGHLEKKADDLKLKSIWCYVLPENTISLGFFQKNGFIVRKQIQIGSDELRILLRKKLP